MRNRHTGENLQEGYVRENFYLCYENNRLIGVFSLKFELTDYLLNFGGHTGYAARPNETGALRRRSSGRDWRLPRSSASTGCSASAMRTMPRPKRSF